MPVNLQRLGLISQNSFPTTCQKVLPLWFSLGTVHLKLKSTKIFNLPIYHYLLLVNSEAVRNFSTANFDENHSIH